jgi:hypothetical protein
MRDPLTLTYLQGVGGIGPLVFAHGVGGIGPLVFAHGVGGIGPLVLADSHGVGGIGPLVFARVGWAVKALRPIALVSTSKAKTTTTNHLDIDPSE